MFGISLPELIVIVVLILVVMGPEKIPDVARTLGKVMREVRRASNLMRDTLMIDEDEFERNRARRVRQVERESEDLAARGSAAELEEPAVLKDSSVRPMMPGGSLDQVDDEMLTASFEKALEEMYGPAGGRLREVRLAPRDLEAAASEGENNEKQAVREVVLAEQAAAPGCRDVHLVVGEKSAEVTSW